MDSLIGVVPIREQPQFFFPCGYGLRLRCAQSSPKSLMPGGREWRWMLAPSSPAMGSIKFMDCIRNSRTLFVSLRKYRMGLKSIDIKETKYFCVVQNNECLPI